MSPSQYGSGADQALTFVLELDPASDTYRMETFSRIDSLTSISFDISSMTGSGPGPLWVFTEGTTIYNSLKTVPPSERPMFSVSAAQPGDEINKSTNYMGVNNMWIAFQ